jgi:cytoskeletal protein CcmA (bactofilin family)
MWNRRREDEYPPKPPASTPNPPVAPTEPVIKEAMPMSTMPVRSFEAEGSRGSATIGKSVVVKGQIFGREDLYIDGEVEGSIEMPEHRLTVGPHGKVNAGVKAREIVVIGTVHGNVDAADKLDLRKDARLVGDIKTARIVIEDGAYFKGSIDIVRPEPKPAPKPAPAPVATAAAAPVPAPPAAVPAAPVGVANGPESKR